MERNKTYETSTIKQLLETLNPAIQVLVGKKQSAEDFHKEVDRIVTPLLKPIGMQYTAWGISLLDDYREVYPHEKILTLDLERVDDKKYSRKTTWTNVLLCNT